MARGRCWKGEVSSVTLGRSEVNQVLEIGPSGTLTIAFGGGEDRGHDQAGRRYPLTYAQGSYSTGSYGVITGFGTINGRSRGWACRQCEPACPDHERG